MPALLAQARARHAPSVSHASFGQAGTDTAVKSNGEPKRWVLAARLSRMSSRDRERAKRGELIDGIHTQDQRAAEWAHSEGDAIVHVTRDRNVSGAVPPWERPELGPWLTEPEKIVQYDGLLAYEVSRASRDYADVAWLRKWAERHHKELYIIKERLRWPDDRDGVLWGVAAERAYQERQDMIEKTTRELTALRNAGKLTGKPPWGYTSTGSKYDRRLIPTETGRKYIPAIFEYVIDGWSLKRIARWLEDLGVPPPRLASELDDNEVPADSGGWWPPSVGLIIRNPTYMGHRCALAMVPPDDVEIIDGKPVRFLYGSRWILNPHWTYGEVIHECEALVSAAVWKRANEALASRGKRGHSDPENRAMLSGALDCGHCDDSPMYRRTPAKQLQEKNRYLTVYYRCAGRGAGRQSCGLLIAEDILEAAVDQVITTTFDIPVMVETVEYGNEADIEAEVEKIKFLISQLGSRNLPDDEYDAELARLRAERDRVAFQPRIRDTVKLEPTGDTYAGLWNDLPTAERGPWLTENGFKVTATREQVTICQGDVSVTMPLDQRPYRTRVRKLDLGKCGCGCGEDVTGVSGAKRYINVNHANKAYRQRKAAKASAA